MPAADLRATELATASTLSPAACVSRLWPCSGVHLVVNATFSEGCGLGQLTTLARHVWSLLIKQAGKQGQSSLVVMCRSGTMDGVFHVIHVAAGPDDDTTELAALDAGNDLYLRLPLELGFAEARIRALLRYRLRQTVHDSQRQVTDAKVGSLRLVYKRAQRWPSKFARALSWVIPRRSRVSERLDGGADYLSRFDS